MIKAFVVTEFGLQQVRWERGIPQPCAEFGQQIVVATQIRSRALRVDSKTRRA
jgi:hypothetical protein